ncbi:MAG: helix-turn-helix domain-containing protein [Terriglobales bacterium]
MHKSGILYGEAVVAFQRAFISAALRENSGNISRAAPRLGLHRNSLTRLCSILEIDVRQFRPLSRRRPPVGAQPPVAATSRGERLG